MQEVTKFPESFKPVSKSSIKQRFFIADNISQLKEIPSAVELCIIQTNFNKTDLNLLKKLKSQSNDLEFWISSKDLSRENVLLANKIGIKTVINYPVNEKMIEEFFAHKDSVKMKEISSQNQKIAEEIENAKIMIVDDNLMNVELLEEILSDFNIKVFTFLKPKEAYKAVLKEKFDLFLLDVMMPEMSGFELAKKIKETPQNKNTPVLFISALSDSRSKIKGYDLGSVAYIEKPFDIKLIKSQVFNFLKYQKQQEKVTQDKENFLAIIAHDLKTPIRSGINALNLLLNENLGKLGEPQQEIIENMLESSTFMKDMVENILCNNKIQRDKMNVDKQTCDFKDIVQSCIETSKYIISGKNQTIEFHCNLKNPLLKVDLLEIKRVINNLIVNASQYSPEGGKILIKVFKIGTVMGLSVRDFGRGIPFDKQEDVFLEYISLAKKYKTVGTGLGLFVSKTIVEAHGGEINLKSKKGYGTRITILLPIHNKE